MNAYVDIGGSEVLTLKGASTRIPGQESRVRHLARGSPRRDRRSAVPG